MNLSWRQKGACRGLDPEIFYPVSDDEAGTAAPVRAMTLESSEVLEGGVVWLRYRLQNA